MISSDIENHKTQLLTASPAKDVKEKPRIYLGVGVKRGVTIWNLLSIPFGFFTVMQAVHYMNA